MAELQGKKVLVIGGASGVGFAVAAAALAAGAEVVVGSSKKPRIEAAARRLGGGALGCEGRARGCRLLRRDWPVRPSDLHGRRLGQMSGPTRDLDVEASKARMDVRLWGAAQAAKYAIWHIASDGSITLTSGMLVHRPMPGTPLVTASALTTAGLAMGLARDLAPFASTPSASA